MLNLITARKRLRGWTELLTARNIASGKTWYKDARVFAQTVADRYNLPLEKVVGVLAALSVQNRWDVNQRDCENLCRAFSEGEDVGNVAVATYSSQKGKAIDILQAEDGADIASLLGTRLAPKTKSFYDNILYPEKSFRVTIDRWIIRGLGLEASFRNQGNSVPPLYRALEELFRAEALVQELRPCELQAAIWHCIQETAAAENWPDSRPNSGLQAEDYPV